MVALGTIENWQPSHGPVTMWTASPAAREAALNAPRNDLAPSYQQSEHLRGAHYAKTANRQQPRLVIPAWEIPGTCDIATMTTVINSHVRRHDAYHSWFEVDDSKDVIIRRTIENPDLVDFIPVELGHMNPEQIRAHVLTTTPDTLEWGCFAFGIVQHADYFAFYASVDHLHSDGISAFLIFHEIHQMYRSLAQEAPSPPMQVGSYRDYTARQCQRVADLNLASPEIEDWIKFAHETNGDWPSFPLSLGDSQSTNKGAYLTAELLDATETESFETACREAGVRFSGGVLACAALAEYELTGADFYHGFTTYDTRTAGLETMSVGWFTALIPVTVQTAATTFPDAARAAQKSYDLAKKLAGVPMEKVVKLATPDMAIRSPASPPKMVSFLDFNKMPLSELLINTNFGLYGDDLSRGGINMWINRHPQNTTLTISFPDNPVARESVQRYATALTEVFKRASDDTLASAGPHDHEYPFGTTSTRPGQAR